MGQIIVRNLDDQVIEKLKEQAALRTTSLEQTVREILAAAAQVDRADLLRGMDALRSLSPSGSTTSLIRDERDADGAGH